MGKAVVRTCDYKDCPEVGEAVVPVHLIVDGEEILVAELCVNHRTPLLDSAEALVPHIGPHARSTRVYTMAEIEQMKRDLKS